MSAAAPGSEPFVLARRGLLFAASARRLAPAPWFASFALARSRVPPRPGAPAMPDMELPPAMPGETEEDPRTNLPVSDEPRPDSETAPVHASAQKPEIRPQVESKTHTEPAAPFPTRSAPSGDKDTFARPALVGAETVPASAAPAVERPATARAASRMSQAAAPPSLDQASLEAKGHSRAPLGVGPSMQTPSEAGQDDEPGNRPPTAHLPAPEAGASRPAATPVAARRSIRQVTAAQIAARAPANFAMPMGTAQPAPHGDASSAAALRTEIARLAERPRALPAASAEGRVTHRIGTVQVVVRTPPPEPRRVAPASAQALPGGRAPAEPPAARPYRNPWASSRWRGD